MDSTNPLFRMEGISKRYGGVRALEKAELTVQAGRVHAILGDSLPDLRAFGAAVVRLI